MMKKSVDLRELEADYRDLIARQLSLQLATSNSNGAAEISYAPFLEYRNAFYVYVSTLAKHTGNMLGSKQASIMFIQPEKEAVNPFARKRLVFNCQVAEIAKDHELYSPVLDAMQSRLGEVVGLLRSLPDFHLLCLEPQQGQYIAGFGKAFTIDIDNGALSPVMG